MLTGEFRAVTRNSPVTFYYGPDEPRGIDYELAKGYADRLGVEFAFPTQSLHVVPEGTPFTGERPASDQDGAVLGRQAGRSVAEETLSAYGGNKPGRVTFDGPPAAPSAGQEGAAAGAGDEA